MNIIDNITGLTKIKNKEHGTFLNNMKNGN